MNLFVIPLSAQSCPRLTKRAQRSRRLFFRAFAIPAVLAGVSAVHAQSAPDSATAGTGSVVLDEIVVTANRSPTPERQVGSAVTIISAEELEDQQIRIVSDVLRRVPGVAVNRTGTAGQLTQLRIRGSEGNQTLVLIDGIEVNDPSAGSEFDFAHLLAQDIERIEVLRGPQSALYGSDAVGGVVNIVTRRGTGDPKVSGSLEGGSLGTVRANAAASGGDERFDFLVSGLGYSTDGISVADEALGNTERDSYRNGTGLVKFGFHPHEAVDVDFVGRYTEFDAEDDDFVGGMGAVDDLSARRGKQLFGRLQAAFRLFDGRWENLVGITHADSGHDYLSDDVVTSTYRGTKNKIDYQANIALPSPAAGVHQTLTLLAEHEVDGVEVGSAFSDLDRTIGSTGFVGQYRLGVMDAFFLTASVRHDRNDLFADATTYRLTGAYNIDGTGTKLRASYGTGVKNPTLFELYGYTQNYQGNPNLKPEEARGWDIGLDQRLWGDRILVDATYFEQRIANLITGAGDTSVNLPGESEIDGVELGVSLSPLDRLTIRAAYTYMDGKDSTGARLVRRPEHIASLDLNYAFLDGRTNLNLGIVYNGQQTDWAYDAFYNTSVVTLDAYTLVNLAGSFRLNDNAEIYARIENLFDAHYQEVWTYGAPGRTAYAGLRVGF